MWILYRAKSTFYTLSAVYSLILSCTDRDVLLFHAALIPIPLSLRPHGDHEYTQRIPGTKLHKYTIDGGKLSIGDL